MVESTQKEAKVQRDYPWLQDKLDEMLEPVSEKS